MRPTPSPPGFAWTKLACACAHVVREGESPAEPRPPGSAGASPSRLGRSLALPARQEPRPPGSAGASPSRLGRSLALPLGIAIHETKRAGGKYPPAHAVYRRTPAPVGGDTPGAP